MLKNMKMRRDYFIINIDGPYAREIYEVLKRGQAAKGEWPEGDISFEEWKRQIFEEEGQGWRLSQFTASMAQKWLPATIVALGLKLIPGTRRGCGCKEMAGKHGG